MQIPTKDVYKVWEVYDEKLPPVFYVINTITRQFQSRWDSLMDARVVARDLNTNLVKLRANIS